MTPSGPVGLDLDNTIIGYDRLFLRLAVDAGLVAPGAAAGKKAVRDLVRLLPDGEEKWQDLQAEAYGPRLLEADLIPGVADFVLAARRAGRPLAIVSHKTEYASHDRTRTNLRRMALRWLESRGFFAAGELGFRTEEVFFESSRAGKLARIRELGCRFFVDDLEETFLEPDFPAGVGRVLFDPAASHPPRPGVTICHDWAAIQALVLGPDAPSAAPC